MVIENVGPSEARLLISFALAMSVAGALTPVARRVGLAFDLVDRPQGWKSHLTPTPYLGGAAVLAGVTTGSLLGPDLRTVALVLGAMLVLSVTGTLDDAVHLHVGWRLLIELLAGCFLWAVGLGWRLDGPDLMNLVLTCVWVVGVINAFNIIDLMDTLASSVLIASAVGLAVLAQLEGDTNTAVMSIAVGAATLGFLPFNAKRSHIFLGDGGTMALGFLVAAIAMLALHGAEQDSQLAVVAPLLFWVPLADAVWRALERITAGVSIMTAGHDSLADSLQRHVVTPGRVGLLLAAAQAVGSTVAITSIRSGAGVEMIASVMIACATACATAVGSWAILVGLRGVLSGARIRRVRALLLRE